MRDLLEDDRRIEARREEDADPRELLGEPARPALTLEQLAALERAARRPAQVLRQEYVFVAEVPHAAIEDDDGVRLVAHAGDGSA